jgi:hypothetical protein
MSATIADSNMDQPPVAQGRKADKPVIWKILVGALLVYINLENMIAPAPNLLKPSNSDERTGMYLAYFGMIGLGCWLLYSGLKPLWKKRTG